MIRRIWQWLKKLFSRSFKRSQAQDSEIQPSTPTPEPLSYTKIENLFMGLLDNVNRGFGRGAVKGFLMGIHLTEDDFIAWLQNFGSRVLESLEPNLELAQRLVQLGNIGYGDISRVAREIGMQLLAKTNAEQPQKTVSGASATDDAEFWFERGNQQYYAEDFEEAIASYDQAIEFKDDFYLAWYSRGYALSILGRYEEALASYDKAIEFKHDFYLAWSNRGVALSILGRYKEAIASYDKAIEFKHGESATDYAEAWLKRGTQQFHAGDYEEALASCDKAIEFKHDYYLAWSNRGSALIYLGRYEEALASYDKAIEFQYDCCEAWYGRGLALNNLGRDKEAIASYDESIKFKYDGYEAWDSRGVALSDLGRYEEALASSDKAIEFQYDYYKAWYNRGRALSYLGLDEEALASYDKAIEFKYDHYDAWVNRGSALSYLGRYEEALASYDKAIEFKYDDYYVWFNRGSALSDLGLDEEALASYDKAIQFKYDYYEAWVNRSGALSKLERYEEAIASSDKAIAFQYDLYQAWFNRGIAASQSVHCNPLLASMSTIATRNPDLNQRGYEGELVSYKEGLKYCHQDTHPEGWGRLHQAIGRAHYSRGNFDSRPRPYYRQAVAEYNLALQTLTKDNFPELHLEVLQDLIKAYLGLGQTAEAEEVRRLGSDLLRSLLEQQKGSIRKQQLALKFIGFQQLTVDRAVQDGKPLEALELAEAGKNACLSWLLDAWGEEIPKPEWLEIKQLINPSTAIVYWHLSPYALHTFIVKDSAPEPIVLDLTANGEENPPQVKRLNDFEEWVKDWNQQYKGYRETSNDNKESHSWRKGLSSRLNELARILNNSGIEAQLEGVTHLILIPHRDLHRFPLHSLFSNDFTITYLPSAVFGLKLLNKKRSHLETEESREASLLSVEVEASDLPFTKIQSAVIREMFADAYQRLNGKVLNKDKVIDAMLREHQFLYFTGHGVYDFDKPSNSGLVLGKKKVVEEEKEKLVEERLTLAEMNRLGEYRIASSSGDRSLAAFTVSPDLSHYRMAYLPVCETALTGNQTITTEYVGIASCFLRQGVSCAISTLWRVNTLSTCLLTIRFYQILTGSDNFPNFDTLDVAKALKEAQIWLQTLTKQSLLTLVEQLNWEDLDKKRLRGVLKNYAYDINPFEDPYHWAGFCVIGY